jgi:hypothetical protein
MLYVSLFKLKLKQSSHNIRLTHMLNKINRYLENLVETILKLTAGILRLLFFLSKFF